MKKILFSLVIMLISISAFSQRITYSKSLYDSFNRQYIKTTINNNSNKTVVCIVFTVEYNYPDNFDVRRYETTTVRVNITPRTSKTFTYYPPTKSYKAIVHYISKVIYSDGTYKEY